GEPGHRDLFLAAPLLEFLDAAVGKVHQLPWGMAVSMISRWVVACSLAEPPAGAELAGSDSTPTWRPSTRGSFSAMVGQAPMLAGSSCTQVTDSASGYRASSAQSSETGSGYSRSTRTIAVSVPPPVLASRARRRAARS